jgi:predicted ATP-grasp superfamily ATP-dependent carboligase
MKRILVTGAGGSATHNFIDSLRISGEEFYIVGVDTKPYHIELSPVDQRYIVPLAREPHYIDVLNKIIEKEQIEFLHAQPDVEVDILSTNRDRLEAKTMLPSHKTLQTFANKMACNEIWAKAGVQTPEAYSLTSEESIVEAVSKLLEMHPKVWVRAIRGAGSRASLPVNRPDDAVAWIKYWQNMRGLTIEDFMVSEFLPGKEFAFQSLWQDGKIITSQARERVEYIFGHLTPSGQSSSPSIARSVHRDDVNEMATKAILAVDPHATGIFCADMKENDKAQVCLTEVNAGRFFTTSNFFAHAGSNMPHYYIKMAYGESLPDLPQYNAVEADLYWVRMIDMGYKLVRDGEWGTNEL